MLTSTMHLIDALAAIAHHRLASSLLDHRRADEQLATAVCLVRSAGVADARDIGHYVQHPMLIALGLRWYYCQGFHEGPAVFAWGLDGDELSSVGYHCQLACGGLCAELLDIDQFFYDDRVGDPMPPAVADWPAFDPVIPF